MRRRQERNSTKMKVGVEIYNTELEGDYRSVDGLRLVCQRCGHEVEVFGTSDVSARCGAAILRDECPEGENNFYDVSFWK
jgi:rRNA maturation endonuclease Nob1